MAMALKASTRKYCCRRCDFGLPGPTGPSERDRSMPANAKGRAQAKAPQPLAKGGGGVPPSPAAINTIVAKANRKTRRGPSKAKTLRRL